MKSILFNAVSDRGHAARLDLALDLARTFEGHLTLVCAVPYEAAVSPDPFGAAFAAMVPVWQEEARQLREKTERDLANEDVPWDWIDRAGPVSLALLRHSSLADIVLVGAREPRAGGKAPSFTAGELAISASCPVLVLPEDCRKLDLGKPALVAWNGSAEASHALKAAVPILQRAGTVYLASIREDTEARANEHELASFDAAEYLSRHGVACELVEIVDGGEGTAAALQQAAAVRNAGLIVMGAYGRNRLAEWIFGGVTRAMLSDVRIPLFLMH